MQKLFNEELTEELQTFLEDNGDDIEFCFMEDLL